MKKIRILYFMVLVAFLASCTDKFLDLQDPNKQTVSTFWQTEDDLHKGIVAAYQPMMARWGGYYGELNNMWNDLRTPDYWMYALGDYGASAYTNTISDFSDYYHTTYTGINYANQVLQYGSAAPIDEAVKARYMAEAHFLRGLYYFFLVNDFGDVPIHTTVPQIPDETNIEKSTREEVWQLVISDLTTAVEGLPATRELAEAGRATKGAALAYLGRSYLYRGDWAKAQTTLKSIVDNASTYQYKLQQNYGELFDGQHEDAVEKGGGEGIFVIHWDANGSDMWGDNSNPNRMFNTWQAVLFAPGAIGGWQSGYALPWLRDSFLVEPTVDGSIDPRGEATLAWDHYPNNPDYTFYQKNYHNTWGKGGWTDSNGRYYEQVFIKKYQNWWQGNEDAKSYLDYYGMRYADVLLMLAEAYTMQDHVAEAAPLVKQIRDRAHLAVKDFTASRDVMMAEIRTQRHLEFSWEMRYFYDLRRWGLLSKVVNECKKPHYERYAPKFDYLPIPLDEINSNSKITQNPLWQ